MFHKEGSKILAWALIIIIVINLIVDRVDIKSDHQYIIFSITMIFFVLIAQFFRNPKRKVNASGSHILAPVDGKVVAIEEVYVKEYFDEEKLKISIFMSPLNVHVTRYPISGKIVYNEYHKGKFLVAWHPKSSSDNEQTSIVIRTKEFGDVMYKQIAGAMARRIVNYAQMDAEVQQGHDSGFIKFGSRVDVLLPLSARKKVSLNDTVKGAKTVLAVQNDDHAGKTN